MLLILKKKHDSNQVVDGEARFKIISIENEAPLFLKEDKVSKGFLPMQSLSWAQMRIIWPFGLDL